MTTTPALLHLLDMCAVAVSAVTGALEAGRRRMDLFGVIFVALVAAVGGGTLRDLLLHAPAVFWIADQTYAVIAVLAAVATFFLARLITLPANAFLLPDAFGLGLFTILGTEKALAFHLPWFPATLMGVGTGVVGGILRDVLCGQIPVIFRGQLYATVAWCGAMLLIALRGIGVEPRLAGALCILSIIALRLAAIVWKLSLPEFHNAVKRQDRDVR